MEEVEDNEVDSELDNEEVRDSVDERVGVEESVCDFESVREGEMLVDCDFDKLVVSDVDRVGTCDAVSEFVVDVE